jgi:hypothetical protein
MKLCVDWFHNYPAFLDALSYVVILDIDVFAAIVKDRIFAELDGGLVINLQYKGTGFLSSELCKEPRQPDSLARSRRSWTYSASQLDNATTFCF